MPLEVKNLPANAGDTRDVGLIPGLGRSPGEENGNPLQHSCLENPMGRVTWWATIHRVAKSQTRLSSHTHTHTHTAVITSLATLLPDHLYPYSWEMLCFESLWLWPWAELGNKVKTLRAASLSWQGLGGSSSYWWSLHHPHSAQLPRNSHCENGTWKMTLPFGELQHTHQPWRRSLMCDDTHIAGLFFVNESTWPEKGAITQELFSRLHVKSKIKLQFDRLLRSNYSILKKWLNYLGRVM